MTNEQLKELLARAIYDADPATFFRDGTSVSWDEASPPYRDGAMKSAQAVIEALAPMMNQMAKALLPISQLSKAYKEHGAAWLPEHIIYARDSANITIANLRATENSLASLPDCWREKGGV